MLYFTSNLCYNVKGFIYSLVAPRKIRLDTRSALARTRRRSRESRRNNARRSGQREAPRPDHAPRGIRRSRSESRRARKRERQGRAGRTRAEKNHRCPREAGQYRRIILKAEEKEEKDIKTALFSDQRSLVFKSGKQFRLKFRSSL